MPDRVQRVEMTTAMLKRCAIDKPKGIPPRAILPTLLLMIAGMLGACATALVEWRLPSVHIAYGAAISQFGELRVPEQGSDNELHKWPVVVLVHGGCWLSEYSLEYLRPLASGLTTLGFATWSLEYRRLGEVGGGWPGTLQDIGVGIDYLRALGRRYPLDLERIAVIGHSAGGQLALWSAGRQHLTPESELYRQNPLLPQAVIGLAPVTDLAGFARASGRCSAAAADMLGGSTSPLPFRVRDTTLGIPDSVRILMIHGSEDSIVPSAPSRQFIEARTRRGQQGDFVLAAGADHFAVVKPHGPVWNKLVTTLRGWFATPDAHGEQTASDES